MKSLFLLLALSLLFVLCWPLALAALILWPFVWLMSLPFRIVAIAIEAVLALIRTLLLLPVRILGGGAPRPPGR